MGLGNEVFRQLVLEAEPEQEIWFEEPAVSEPEADELTGYRSRRKAA